MSNEVTTLNSEALAYESWAPFYDITDVDRAPFIAFYGALVTPAVCSLLELGCGTGTVAGALAQRMGHPRRGTKPTRVIGIDGSRAMLTVARRRFSQIDWRFGDMRAPPLEGLFDLQICAFNTLQHLLTDDDLALTLEAARRHVEPNGTLAFDVYQPNRQYLESPHSNRLAKTVTDSSGRALEVREDTSYDSASRVLIIRWRLRESGSMRALAETQYRMRQYFRPDIDAVLERTGWRVRQRYGEFDRSPFTPDSRKQILVCDPA